METTVYKLCLDLQHRASPILLPIPQRDTARALQIRLTQGGIAYPLPEDAVAVLTAQDPSGAAFPWLPCELTQGSIFCPIPASHTAQPGIVRCQLRLYAAAQEGLLLTAPEFSLEITEQVCGESQEEAVTPAPNALDALVSQTLAAAQQATAVAEQLTQDAQNGRFNGEKGDTPVRGVDYFTPADIEYCVAAALAQMKFAGITESAQTRENLLCLPDTAAMPFQKLSVTGQAGTARLEIRGKNFFDRGSVRSNLLGEGTRLNISGAGYHYDLFTGSTGVNHGVTASQLEQLPLLPAGTYTVSYKRISDSGYLRVEQVGEDGAVTLLNSSDSPVFTLAAPSRITLRRSINTAMTLEDLQIEVGAVATDYEPYTAPRAYTVPVGEALTGIAANAPTTVLATDPGFGLAATYWADTKAYVQKCITDNA